MAGRKSKLSPAQWGAIRDRLAQGESMVKLGKEFGIAPSRISERVSKSVTAIKDAAKQLVSADETLKALPISDRVSAINLAERLKSISNNLASAADFGARTAHKLNAMAHTKAEALDGYDPLANPEDVKSIAILTDMANNAGRMGVELLKANKDAVDTINQRDDPITRIERVIVQPPNRDRPGIPAAPGSSSLQGSIRREG